MKIKQFAMALTLCLVVFNCYSQASQNKIVHVASLNKNVNDAINKEIIFETKAGLRIEKDQFDGTITYFDLHSPKTADNDGLMLYINEYKDGTFELWLRVQNYISKRFELTRNCELKTDNDQYTIIGNTEPSGKYFKSPDNMMEYSYGWFDTPVSPYIINAIGYLLNSKKPVIICNDRNGLVHSRVITKKEIENIQNVLLAYQVFQTKSIVAIDQSNSNFIPPPEETVGVDKNKSENSFKPVSVKDEDKIYNKVEIEASYPGGDVAWRKFVHEHINPNTPIKNGAPAGIYQVIVRFIVSKDGSIRDVVAETKFGYGMEAEVIKAIKEGPNWYPALKDGKFVNAIRRQPITYTISVN